GFGAGWDVRMEAPIALDDTSEPEPDVAVVAGSLHDYFTAHPSEPVLVVEVSLTRVALDRRYKSSLYARAGRQEYWVLNLVNRTLEVRREPARVPTAPDGWDYASVQDLTTWDVGTAVAAPDASIAVAALLRPSRPSAKASRRLPERRH